MSRTDPLHDVQAEGWRFDPATRTWLTPTEAAARNRNAPSAAAPATTPRRSTAGTGNGSLPSRAQLLAASESRRDGNPLYLAAVSLNPGRVRAAAATGQAPTLFANGDLPPFTASGIDPQALLSVPWQVRHPIAAETDRGRAYQMMSDYAGPSGLLSAALDHGDLMNLPGNAEYLNRTQEWLAKSMTAGENYDAIYGAREAYDAAQKAK